jgi:cytochrome o ubiquinol oxidase subunit 2
MAVTALSACSGASILVPHGPIAADNRAILFNSLAVMLAIVVPTMLATLGCAWWFRAGNKRARYQPDFVYSGRIELIVWSIPVLVILFLGGIIWIGSHQLDPRRPIAGHGPPLEIQVVSLDWKWLFIYPDQELASVNELMIPVGHPVHFSITSASVMNVFFVPQLGSMIYAMHGMKTDLHLRADYPGIYHGQSAHFSGDGFSDMNFALRAVSEQQFTAWATQAQQASPRFDGTALVSLMKPSLRVPAQDYRAVPPQLFRILMTQTPQSGNARLSGGRALPRTAEGS